MPASVAGGFLNLIPLFGIGATYVVLGERLSPAQWAGGGLILLAAMSLLRLQAATSGQCPKYGLPDQLGLAWLGRQRVKPAWQHLGSDDRRPRYLRRTPAAPQGNRLKR